MGFDLRHDPRRTDMLVRLEDTEDLEAWMPWRRGLAGDVVVTLLPRELLPSVLEPLTSALAARSRFSLERFSDVYIVTRAVCRHVAYRRQQLPGQLLVDGARPAARVDDRPARPAPASGFRRSGPHAARRSVAELADELGFERSTTPSCCAWC